MTEHESDQWYNVKIYGKVYDRNMKNWVVLGVKRKWQICMKEFYVAIKKNEIMKFVRKLMAYKINMITDISQRGQI